jgi:transposase
MKRFIGVDLHKNMFTVCIFTPQEGRFEELRYRLSKIDEFKKILLETDEVAVESTGNTRYFINKIKSHVSRVRVINPTKFKIISESTQKTDRRDAKTIAIFLSKGLIPEVRMKEGKAAQLHSLASTRDKLVKLRTSLKNKLHNILNAHGYITKREMFSGDKGLQKVLDYNVDDVAAIEIEVIVDQIRSLNKSIAKLDKELEERGKDLKGFENITSIKGIGKKGGIILLSIIGDINNFASEKKLASYLGIVPRVRKSNEIERNGRITKRGSKLGRTILVQCTLIALRYSRYLRIFYERIRRRRGSGKAIIATARKLVGIIYKTLKNGFIFEDFPNYVYKRAY